MSAESSAIWNIDRGRRERAELSPTMQLAYERATRDVLDNPDYAIQETDFIEAYGQEAVARETAEAKRLERIFEQENTREQKNSKKIADVLEAIVLMQSEMNEWLGSATTLRTTKYDDYVNKVDMLAEWHHPEDGSRVLALAVDVTFGTSGVDKKMREIKQEIENGSLGKVRYFKDTEQQFIGMRNNVPRAVIGVNQQAVEELARLWLDNDNRTLAKHPIQRLFIGQMVFQLTAMRDYAQRIGQQQVVSAYNQALATLRPLVEAKRVITAGNYKEDAVVQAISEGTRTHFPSVQPPLGRMAA